MHVPTRLANILDLVLISEPGMIEEVQVKEHFSTSGHNILVWHLKCEAKVSKSEMKKFAYHRADYKAMNEWLTKIDWNVILGGNEPSIDEVWERFVTIINEAVEICCTCQ